MRNWIFKNESGFGLLEVVVSLGVILFVMLSLISMVSRSFDAASYARNKSLATKYAQEVIEWLRLQRNSSWGTLYNIKAGNAPAGIVYTLNCDLDLNLGWTFTGTQCGSSTIDDQYDIFNRQVTLIKSGSSPPFNNDSITVRVVVSWSQGSRPSDVSLETSLTKWQ